MEKTGKKIFITVGTTKFEELIKHLDEEETLKVFKEFGYTNLVYQIGRGEYKPTNYSKVSGLKVEVFPLKPSLIDDLKSADIVISHCGMLEIYFD
jgi:beta-1,4-N-acetylglucosaminyltransferase